MRSRPRRVGCNARIALACLLTLVASCSSAARESGPVRQTESPQFWRELAAKDGALEDGANVGELLVRLTPLFGDPDPTLRDDCGYALAARWIYSERAATPDDLRRVLDAWIDALRVPERDRRPDGALERSFSALSLSLVAARDLATPFLAPDEFERLLDAALTYLASERDERGFDPRVGWVHATAHTADLLKFLARNPRLDSNGQRRILEALAARITRPAAHAFSWGEDQRLARAAGSVLLRADCDATALGAFVESLREARTRSEAARPFDPSLFAAQLNAEHVLDVLLVGIDAIDPRPPQALRALDALRGAR